jgi:hypothetical protein
MEMMDFNGKKYFAEYSKFYIDDESQKYMLHLGGVYSGNISKNYIYFQSF